MRNWEMRGDLSDSVERGTSEARTHIADYHCTALIPCHFVTQEISPPTMGVWHLKCSLYLQGQIFSRHFLPQVHSLRTHQESSLQFPSPLNSTLQQLSLLRDPDSRSPREAAYTSKAHCMWAPPPAFISGHTRRDNSRGFLGWRAARLSKRVTPAAACCAWMPALEPDWEGALGLTAGPASQHPPRELLAASLLTGS